MERTRHRVWTAAAGIGCLTILVLVGLAVRDRVPGLDAWALRSARSAPGSTISNGATIFSAISTPLGVAVLAAAASLALWQRRGAAIMPLLRLGVLFVVSCLTVLLQDVFQRQGPTSVPDWSYPSGHVVIMTAIAVTAVVASAQLAAPRRRLVWAAAGLAVAITAASRVALGEHFLTDVVGAVLGTVGTGLLMSAALGMVPAPNAHDGRVPVSS